MAGSRFVRADLHVHTMLGPGEASAASPPSVEAALRAARDAGLSIIGIADHNTIANIGEALAGAGADLLVLPGVELSTAEGHVVGLFPPDGVDRLERLMQPDVVSLRTIDASGAQRSRRTMAELAHEIAERGGLAIAAHIDTADGLLTRANAAAMSDLLAEPGLAAIELTNRASLPLFTAADPDAVRRQLWAERRTRLGIRAPLARIMSSDAHSPETIGIDSTNRTLTRLRLDELNFDGVYAAIRVYPDARCKLEVNLAVHYPRVVRARFEGGFLDGIELEFSPNLNCLIGGRGSGKSTALDAIRSVLRGFAPTGLDDHTNMPDYTELEFVDELGSTRKAGRHRHARTHDVDDPDASLSLEFNDLEQDFGGGLHTDDPTDPVATREFLMRFVDEDIASAADLDCVTRLQANGDVLRRTSTAQAKLKALREQRNELDRKLATAKGTNLTKVAEYARLIAGETPLLDQLSTLIEGLPSATLPAVPDLRQFAARHGVDVVTSPSKKLLLGPNALEDVLKALSEQLASAQRATQAEVRKWIVPTKASLARWRRQLDGWNREIEKRKATLRQAGMTLQVEELSRIRGELTSVTAEIRKYEAWEAEYRDARAERFRLVAELYRLRDARHTARKETTRQLTRSMNRAVAGASAVQVTWEREGMRAAYATRLGQLFDLHSPRKERLASAVTPSALARIAWRNDSTALTAIGAPEQFFPDPGAALKLLRRFDVLFELETMDLDSRPAIMVRFRGDPTGQFRRLSELSLGQLRSVLLGFILASEGSSPLVLDQPEEQLDGPFIADIVVGHLHDVKERRQLIVATHNPNIVVLGDAELVIPLLVVAGQSAPVDQGSVDSTSTKDQIVRLLEGGPMAFERRAVRYGIGR